MPHLNCRGKYLDLSHPQIMGILNITPNSFCPVGRFLSVEHALAYAEQMVAEGAAIIDVGGEPTNPGVHPIVSLQEELGRVIPVVEILARTLPVPISVDTSKPEVMREAIVHGAGFINDVRALQHPGALKVVAETQVAVCLMHMGALETETGESLPQQIPPPPKEGASTPFFKGGNSCKGGGNNSLIVSAVKNFLQVRIDVCLAAGIQREQIVLDPGIGGGHFGKNLAQNLQLLAHLDKFQTFQLPLLVGVSRKSFIGELLNLPVEERLYGSLAAAVMAVVRGATIIRTHDVKATVEAVKIADAILQK